MTVTLGTKESFTVTGEVTVDPDADITYAVKEGSEQNFDGESANVIEIEDLTQGTVTIKGAGTATVTVSAEKTDKVDATFTTYQVKVEKGTPVIKTDFGKSYTFGTAPDEMTDYTATLESPGNDAPDPTGDLAYQFYGKYENGALSELMAEVPRDVGTYYLQITYGGDKNYEGKTEVVEIKITAATVQVEVVGYGGEDGLPYNGESHDAATFTVKEKDANGKTLALGTDYTLTITKGDEKWENISSEAGIPQVENFADSGTYSYTIHFKTDNYGED